MVRQKLRQYEDQVELKSSTVEECVNYGDYDRVFQKFDDRIQKFCIRRYCFPQGKASHSAERCRVERWWKKHRLPEVKKNHQNKHMNQLNILLIWVGKELVLPA